MPEETRAAVGRLEAGMQRDEATIEALRAENAQLRRQLNVPFTAQEIDSAPGWTPENREALRKFLATETGRKMAETINFWTQVKAREAALRMDRHEYACGAAAGWYNLGDFLLNKLSADLPLQTEDDTAQGAGAAGDRERMAP